MLRSTQWVCVPLIIAFAGCRPSTPTSPQREALKQVAQEFPCEAVILDTVISAIVYSERGNPITLNSFEEHIYRDGVYSEETYIRFSGNWDSEDNWPQGAAIFTRAPKHFELVQVFDDTVCNIDFEQILLQEIRSSEMKVEQYACAASQVEQLMDSMWLDAECDINCWNGMEARKTRAYERLQYYQEELQNARNLFRYFFEDRDCSLS